MPDCSQVALPPCTTQLAAQFVGTAAICVPAACDSTCTLEMGVCRQPREECPRGFEREGELCLLIEDLDCYNYPEFDHCIPPLCADTPTAYDGTDLVAAGKCELGEPPPPESCVDNCHNTIENPHPWFGGPDLTCTGCHGGNPDASDRGTAHVPIPEAWQANSAQIGRPNLRYYWNYLTLAGAENFPGGLEWLRFRNPSDLRVADQSCGKNVACHQSRVINVQRSVMATEIGLVGVAQARNGIGRTVLRNGDAIYKWDTTEGFTPAGDLEASAYDPDYVGSVSRLTKFRVQNREYNGAYDQIEILKELYDKQCGDCHLGSAGANNRYADFRSSGCAACHMRYNLNGRSSSTDQMISKTEPTYPAAYAAIANYNVNDLQNLNGAWLGPERPHPVRHTLTRQMASQRCGTCHVGSNRTDWQYRGYQIDPNRTAVAAIAAGTLNAGSTVFTDEIDNEADAFARYHGQAQNQVLKAVDWNADNRNDIPADIHFLAGLECMDCHTGAEMHNELQFVKVARVDDWEDESQVKDMSGALWSHMDQATEIECVHCHGNLEYRAASFAIDNRNPIKNLVVCPEAGESFPGYTPPGECSSLLQGPGRYLKSKFTGRYHYVPQTRDTVNDVVGGPAWPDGSKVYNENASIFHGRVNADLTDGVGPCVDGNLNNCFVDQGTNQIPISVDFSHLGRKADSPVDQHQGGLECYSCHATWSNMCFGCHLRLADNDGNVVLRDFMRSTGELTYGQVAEADFTYISPLDQQYGVNSEGKISQFLPETKQMVAHTNSANQEYFGQIVQLKNDANIHYNIYRDRSGYGTRRYAFDALGLPPSADGPIFEQLEQMDVNAGQGSQQMMPHSVQRSDPLMDCENCHVDQDAANIAAIKARFMANPTGFANVSAYLQALDAVDIVRNNSQDAFNVVFAAGFRFDAVTDPNAFVSDQQADWCVDEATGFPYCHNNHPMKIGNHGVNFSTDYLRNYPSMARIAGPLPQQMLDRMFNRIRANNEGVLPRAGR